MENYAIDFSYRIWEPINNIISSLDFLVKHIYLRIDDFIFVRLYLVYGKPFVIHSKRPVLYTINKPEAILVLDNISNVVWFIQAGDYIFYMNCSLLPI